VLAVDTSRYGLATALPSAVTAALDAPVEPPVPRRRQQRRQQARQLWRVAVADAAVGAPTPIVVRAPAHVLDCPGVLEACIDPTCSDTQCWSCHCVRG
jgi:hypothetical protein